MLLPDSQDTTTRAAPPSLFRLFDLLHLGEIPDPPELEILVARTGTNDIACWANCTPENSCVVSVAYLTHAFHRRIRVYHERVCRKAVRGQEFFAVRGPLDGGDL